MFEVDNYLKKKFDILNYNCWHFVRDVWFELTGEMLYDYTPARPTKHDMHMAAEDAIYKFLQVNSIAAWPKHQPLIVLMKRRVDTPHVGVFYKGKVLHLTPEGARYLPLDVSTVGYEKITFYTTMSHT